MATSTYLTRTGTSGNQKTFTFAGWFKIQPEVQNFCWTAGIYGSTIMSQCYFESDGTFVINHFNATPTQLYNLVTDRLFRDPAAWYHVVVAMDTTQSVAADRTKIYINGVQETSFSTETYPVQDYDTAFNSTLTQSIGRRDGSATYYDGVMAHLHAADGLAYAPTVFGETDATSGIWIAKSGPSVTYGTNGGFYKFAAGALGTDSSGEGNNMTVTGTMTTTKDTPDNNFCTWNPLTQNGGTYSNGNTSRTAGDDTGGTLGVTKGKWYWEYKRTNTSNSIHYGICSTSNGFNNAGQQMLNGGTDAVGASLWLSEGGTATDAYGNAGGFSSVSYSVPSVSISNGDIIGVALDISTSSGTVEWFENGVSLGTASFTYDDSVPVYPFIRLNTSVTTDTNFGNGYFGTTVISSAGTSSSGDDSIWEYDCPANHYGLNTNNIATYG